MRKGWRKREHMPGRAKRGARVFAVLLALLCAFRLAGVHELIPITWLHRPPDGVQHLIDANAERFSLDKDLLQAVILTESHFDEDAVSETGAVGMMQLMPDTAEWIVEESGLPGGDLTDPKKNIPLGSWYLDYLLKNMKEISCWPWRRTMRGAAMWIRGWKSGSGPRITLTPTAFPSRRRGNL